MANKYLIGYCNLDLVIENSQSLKEKRRVIASLKEKIRGRFNAAVCEFGDLSLWQRSQLAVVTCGNEKKLVDATIKAITNYVEKFHSVTIVNTDFRII